MENFGSARNHLCINTKSEMMVLDKCGGATVSISLPSWGCGFVSLVLSVSLPSSVASYLNSLEDSES